MAEAEAAARFVHDDVALSAESWSFLGAYLKQTEDLKRESPLEWFLPLLCGNFERPQRAVVAEGAHVQPSQQPVDVLPVVHERFGPMHMD